MNILSRRLLTLALGFLLSSSAFVRAQGFVASVSGTQKIQGTKANGASIIKSLPVNLKSLCAEFSVDAKDYAAVYDPGAKTLTLTPISASAGLTTFTVWTTANNYTAIDSSSPKGFLTVDDISATNDANGTDFEGFTGIQSITVRQDSNSNTKGFTATITGVGTSATNDGSFIIKVAGTKQFVQKP